MKIDSTQSLAIDPNQLQQITANMSDTDGLQKAAEQFEAIFLQLVLNSMHSASDVMAGESGLLNSREMKHFRGMHDAQLAQYMAGSQQLGLAEHIVRQLGEGLSEVENKFKQWAEPVALSHQGPAFTQSLHAPTDALKSDS
ncbi:rod-binding protein [Bowmanella pacifica]|uniref:Flagellar protein FlgJ N-terminal domain-containing protein n=1 Tax=Bowmanella pacifica TaxID=502051 RepID=A0A918DJD9_9ALTE|nr:rod-binding protein [Bowmanella pacifica]GGO69331.1 hypothetical protein GCM10010982_20220 [Bowmanella pacifica]